MIARREFLFAGGCAAALGTAEWLRPREMRLLLPANEKITNIVPLHFGSWQAGGGGDIVLPDVKDSLASMLYSDRVARSYRETAGHTVHDVMLLIAYGRSQSDTLQLHRPETCYPATGFAVTFHQLTELPIADGVSLPAVMLTAEAGDRVEDIIYWTRLGEKMPRTLTEQRATVRDGAPRLYRGRRAGARLDDPPPRRCAGVPRARGVHARDGVGDEAGEPPRDDRRHLRAAAPRLITPPIAP